MTWSVGKEGLDCTTATANLQVWTTSNKQEPCNGNASPWPARCISALLPSRSYLFTLTTSAVRSQIKRRFFTKSYVPGRLLHRPHVPAIASSDPRIKFAGYPTTSKNHFNSASELPSPVSFSTRSMVPVTVNPRCGFTSPLFYCDDCHR